MEDKKEMSPMDALAIVDKALQMVNSNRQDHILLVQCVELLKKTIESKEVNEPPK